MARPEEEGFEVPSKMACYAWLSCSIYLLSFHPAVSTRTLNRGSFWATAPNTEELLSQADKNSPILKSALFWDDRVDGRPSTESKIYSALQIIAERLQLEYQVMNFSKRYNFTTTYQNSSSSIGMSSVENFTLHSSSCDQSIKNFVLDELKYDKYDIGHHPLSQDGDIALDIGGHVGGAALQIAKRATGKGATVITFEPTRENSFYNQWNVRKRIYAVYKITNI